MRGMMGHILSEKIKTNQRPSGIICLAVDSCVHHFVMQFVVTGLFYLTGIVKIGLIQSET